MNGWVGEWVSGREHRSMSDWVVWMSGWVDVQMGVSMGAWVDEWIDGWAGE
jgi:hypothetical protein